MIKPLDDRIVVEKVDPPQQTPGGLYVVGSEFGPHEGRVLAKSDRCTLGVEVGEVVIYSQYDGVEVEHEGRTLLIINSKGVLAVKWTEPTGGEQA